MSPFAPTFDVSAAAQTLKSDRRVHIPNMLSEADASALLAGLNDVNWSTAIFDNGRIGMISSAMAASLDAGQRMRVAETAHVLAGSQFQYLYDKLAIDAACETGYPCPPVLAQFYAALNTPLWIDTFRALTGDDGVSFVDCHATRYRPGHFLSTHNDDDLSGGRLYAYVLNLTRAWRIEWGGLLQFHDEQGHIARAYAPRWNALNVFAVSQFHSVSMITPGARGDRLSLTGWLRLARPHPP